MATKSEGYRYRMERSGAKKAKQPPRPRRDVPVDTSLPGVSATDRRAGAGSTAIRNFSRKAGRNAAYALEDTAPKPPSRRSTRKSANRAKPSHPQRQAKTSQVIRPGPRPE
jgi:hypothetical protein